MLPEEVHAIVEGGEFESPTKLCNIRTTRPKLMTHLEVGSLQVSRGDLNYNLHPGNPFRNLAQIADDEDLLEIPEYIDISNLRAQICVITPKVLTSEIAITPESEISAKEISSASVSANQMSPLGTKSPEQLRARRYSKSNESRGPYSPNLRESVSIQSFFESRTMLKRLVCTQSNGPQSIDNTSKCGTGEPEGSNHYSLLKPSGSNGKFVKSILKSKSIYNSPNSKLQSLFRHDSKFWFKNSQKSASPGASRHRDSSKSVSFANLAMIQFYSKD